MKKVVIIGGGAAGLSLSICLDKSGFDVKIFEKRSQNHDNGLGLLLLSNGLSVLKKMDLDQKMLKKIHPLNHFHSQFSNGQSIKNEPMEEIFGAKRADILSVLANEVSEHSICYDQEFSHFNYDENGFAKSVVFSNGLEVEGDIFIGADGANSCIRKELFSQSKLSSARVKEIVSLVKSPALVKKLNGSFVKTECRAGGRAVGILPCSKEDVVWFFQFDEQLIDFSTSSNIETRAFLMHQLSSWPSPVKDVLEVGDFSRTFLWNTRDMDPLPAYHYNNIGLIGDAAHNFTTFTSQGLNCALEDSFELATILAKMAPSASINKIFGEYFKTRSKVTEKYLHLGRHLRDQFLDAHAHVQQKLVPLAIN